MADPSYSYQAPSREVQDMLMGRRGAFGLFPGVSGYFQNQFANLGAPDSNPYTYSGQRIAGFSPREEYAMQLSDQGIGSYLPYLARSQGLTEDALATMGAGTTEAGAAMRRAGQMGEDYTRAGLEAGTGYTGEAARRMREAGDAQYDPTSGYQDYMNQYEDKVVQQALEDLNKGYLKGDIGRRASEVGAGAFGGARSQLAGEQGEEDFMRGAMKEVAGIRSQGYGQAQQQGMSEFARQQAAKAGSAQGIGGLGQQLYGMGAGAGQQMYGMGMGAGQGLSGLAGQLAGQQMGGAQAYTGLGGMQQQMGGQDVQSMMNVGAMNRARNQAGLDLNYQNFVGQYNLPMQMYSQYANMITGAGPLAGGTGYAGPTNPYAYTGGNTGGNQGNPPDGEAPVGPWYAEGGRVSRAASRFPLSSQRLTGIMSLG